LGTFSEDLPISEGLKKYAEYSALQDKRFNPMTIDEVSYLKCGVSLLHSSKAAKDLDDWVIGRHGVTLSFEDDQNHHYSATYLPEIALENNWSKADTIRNLVHKSGYKKILSTAKNVQLNTYESCKAELTWEECIIQYRSLDRCSSQQNEVLSTWHHVYSCSSLIPPPPPLPKSQDEEGVDLYTYSVSQVHLLKKTALNTSMSSLRSISSQSTSSRSTDCVLPTPKTKLKPKEKEKEKRKENLITSRMRGSWLSLFSRKHRQSNGEKEKKPASNTVDPLQFTKTRQDIDLIHQFHNKYNDRNLRTNKSTIESSHTVVMKDLEMKEEQKHMDNNDNDNDKNNDNSENQCIAKEVREEYQYNFKSRCMEEKKEEEEEEKEKEREKEKEKRGEEENKERMSLVVASPNNEKLSHIPEDTKNRIRSKSESKRKTERKCKKHHNHSLTVLAHTCNNNISGSGSWSSSGGTLGSDDSSSQEEKIKRTTYFHKNHLRNFDNKIYHSESIPRNEKKKDLERSRSRSHSSIERCLFRKQHKKKKKIASDTDGQIIYQAKFVRKEKNQLKIKNIQYCNHEKNEMETCVANRTSREYGTVLSNPHYSSMSMTSSSDNHKGIRPGQENCEREASSNVIMKCKSGSEESRRGVDTDVDMDTPMRMGAFLSECNMLMVKPDKFESATNSTTVSSHWTSLNNPCNTSCRNEEQRISAFIDDEEGTETIPITEEAG